MSGLQFYAYPGWGEFGRKHLSYSQAVRINDRIETSGQGGWDPTLPNDELIFPKTVDEEVDQAFENVAINLKHAGGKGWSQVYRVTTYAPDIDLTHERIIANYRKHMPNHQPIWTEVGVKRLGHPDMHIEIEVVAYDPEGAKAA